MFLPHLHIFSPNSVMTTWAGLCSYPGNHFVVKVYLQFKSCVSLQTLSTKDILLGLILPFPEPSFSPACFVWLVSFHPSPDDLHPLFLLCAYNLIDPHTKYAARKFRRLTFSNYCFLNPGRVLFALSYFSPPPLYVDTAKFWREESLFLVYLANPLRAVRPYIDVMSSNSCLYDSTE